MTTAAPPAIKFFVSGRPSPKGSLHTWHTWGPLVNGVSTCRTGLSESSGGRLREWRALVATAAKRAMGQRPPFTGPVRVELTFLFPRPTSHTKAQRAIPWAYTTATGDIEKLTRACHDAFTDAAVWDNDCRAVMLTTTTLYSAGEPPGVLVVLEALA